MKSTNLNIIYKIVCFGLYIFLIIFSTGCGSKSGSPEAIDISNEEVPPKNANRYIFIRTAKLMNRNYEVLGCANNGNLVEARDWIPYPQDINGKPLRDPDDDGVLSALYEVVFLEDQLCEGETIEKELHYWVSPRALAPYAKVGHDDLTVKTVELSGNGCPDRDSYSFVGTLGAKEFSTLFNRLVISMSDADSNQQELSCNIRVHLMVPQAVSITRIRTITAYRAALTENDSGGIHSKIILSDLTVADQSKIHEGVTNSPFELSVDLPVPDLGFCRENVSFIIEQNISINAKIIHSRANDSREFTVNSTDYSLDVAPCTSP